MEITLDKTSEVEGVIKINLVEADYAPGVDKKIKETSKKANIKGFRAGKVPASYIKKLYGKSILVDEINNIVGHKLSDYIKESKLNVLGEPLPVRDEKEIDWDSQKDFDFSFEIGFVNDLDLKLDKKVKVDAYEISVDKKNIEEAIKSMQERAASNEDVEESAEGDLVMGKLKELKGDIERDTVIKTEVIDGRHKKKFFEKKVGDVVEFEIEKAFKNVEDRKAILGVSAEEAEAAAGKFSITYESIKRKQNPALDQEFFDKVFGKDTVKNEEEFNAKVEEMLKNNYSAESDNVLKRDMINSLVENTTIEMPETFLKKWLLTTNAELTEEVLDKEFDEYKKELKWNLIFSKIISDEKVEVQYDEVREKAKEILLQQLGQTPGITPDFLQGQMDGFADNYLQAEEGKNYRNTHNVVAQEKVLDIVKEKISVGSKKTSWDKFIEEVTKK